MSIRLIVDQEFLSPRPTDGTPISRWKVTMNRTDPEWELCIATIAGIGGAPFMIGVMLKGMRHVVEIESVEVSCYDDKDAALIRELCEGEIIHEEHSTG